ncbi:MAG: biotin/lipoyl-binding protein [Clostridia bacterium]|nr:biotin/lipoyl-binding protein [Clostridia bacterium]
MKAYKVTVNGNVYEITLEVIDKADIKAAPAPAAAAPAPAAAPAAPAQAGAQTVTAPMPGNILKVNVSNGQAVKKGDVLMILEAMKMENEIMCPADGTVASVNVTAGTTVEAGTVLCSIN